MCFKHHLPKTSVIPLSIYVLTLSFNLLQDNKSYALSELEAFADGKCYTKYKYFIRYGRKGHGKKKKMMVTGIDSFPKNVFNRLFPKRCQVIIVCSKGIKHHLFLKQCIQF